MANTYDTGDLVRISCAFTQATIPIDPGTVLAKVLKPDGTSDTYTFALGQVTKDSTGNYHVDLDISQQGTYRYRFTSTAPAQATEENWFQVRARRVA